MRQLQRIDKLIEHLKGQLATVRMSYAEAVIIDDLISVLENARSQSYIALANIRSDDPTQLSQNH